MPLDLRPDGRLEFEDVAGLFASTSLNHGLVGMTIRQVAYIFGLARRSGARKAIEIGRWRGGTTIALAAGLGPGGKLWSIDVGEKEARVFPGRPPAFVGDARTLEVDTGEVDLVLIDGDHTYEGARSDFERFGRRVRVGGGVLLDDAFDEPFFPTHSDTVGRLVAEIAAEGTFALEAQVDRLAHLVRRH